jgi:nucleotidyltransferase substrate binding protein (TIGR01987 family)
LELSNGLIKFAVSLKSKQNMTEAIRWELKLDNYHKALSRLASIVNEYGRRELNEYELDSIIKRFEFAYEVAWRVMKSYAEYQGIDDITGSRDSFRRAFELGLISDGKVWIDMLKSRNETAHNYDGSIADSAISKVCDVFYPEMLKFYNKMQGLSHSHSNDIFSE